MQSFLLLKAEKILHSTNKSSNFAARLYIGAIRTNAKTHKRTNA